MRQVLRRNVAGWSGFRLFRYPKYQRLFSSGQADRKTDHTFDNRPCGFHQSLGHQPLHIGGKMRFLPQPDKSIWMLGSKQGLGLGTSCLVGHPP